MKKLLILMIISVTGCATMINGQRQIIFVGTITPINETYCTLRNEEGGWETPNNSSVMIKRDGNPMLVTCENKDRIGQATVTPSFNAGLLLADVLLIDGCTISCIVDGLNNAFYDYPINIIVPMRYKNEFLIN